MPTACIAARPGRSNVRRKASEYGKTYAIADIHGRLDLLEAAYALLAQEKPGLIVHLGDYVDRGKASSQVIEFLMAGEDTLPSPEWRRVILRAIMSR